MNPLQAGMDALVLDQMLFCSANNVADVEVTDLNDQNNNDRLKFEYRYHTSGKPVSARLGVTGGSIGMFYRYQ
jgi:hypothetical protein